MPPLRSIQRDHVLDYGLDLSALPREQALAGLLTEGEELDALVSAESDWSRPTPAKGRTIAHLAVADANVLTAIRDPAAFGAVLAQAARGGHADLEAAAGAARPREQLLAKWRAGRAEVAEAPREIPLGQGFPWFGSELTATLMVPLRLMETWAHGQDCFDVLKVERGPADRLRHIASLGVVGLGLSFHAARMPVPVEPIRVELTGPEEQLWEWVRRMPGSAFGAVRWISACG